MVWPVCGAAAPAAFLSSLTVWIVPGEFLLAGIAALTTFSGYRTLRPPVNASSDNENIKTRALIAVGAIIRLHKRTRRRRRRGRAHPASLRHGRTCLTRHRFVWAIQFVIAVTATMGNLSVSQIDITIGGVIATALVLGILLGSRVAHALPVDILRKTVAWVLTLVGLSIAFQLVRNAIAV